jgi:hypothetical protein
MNTLIQKHENRSYRYVIVLSFVIIFALLVVLSRGDSAQDKETCANYCESNVYRNYRGGMSHITGGWSKQCVCNYGSVVPI